jgi:hypothetical protein
VVSFEPVDVHVADSVGDPVEGVLVKVYDPTGTTFYSQAISGADGIASFLLETLDYSMRFYKFQVGFSQPQLFTVLAAPEVNAFNVLAELFEMPIATDPRLCRCSGFFRDMTGAPSKWLDMHIIPEFEPIVLDDAAIITGERHVRTDENGYVQVDLIRGGNYYVNIEAMGASYLRRLCQVPDQASANLPDMLFPVVERVVFDPDPISVAVDAELEIYPTVYDSAGRPLTGSGSTDVRYTVEDSSIAGLTVGPDKLVLRGVVAGATRILAERIDTSIIKIPDEPIVGVPMDVTVTP